MPFGPGKYGARAEALLREVPEATLVVVLTVGPPEASAFDVATTDPLTLLRLPRLLRRLADDIERDQRRGNN